MTVRLIVKDYPTETDRAAVAGPLSAFNTRQGYPPDPQPIAILLEDENNIEAGGLYGKTIYDWLFIDLLVVPDAMRGMDIGTQLVLEAEQIASQRGCVGSWLTTFTYQAEEFYTKLGYENFGQLDNCPNDASRLFFRKRFKRESVGAA